MELQVNMYVAVSFNSRKRTYVYMAQVCQITEYLRPLKLHKAYCTYADKTSSSGLEWLAIIDFRSVILMMTILTWPI